ncbi:hypothetical protein L7F22_008433 [Adiantum nelumboides]|nr:hypothetical protein [Adiantum nelumboides]
MHAINDAATQTSAIEAAQQSIGGTLHCKWQEVLALGTHEAFPNRSARLHLDAQMCQSAAASPEVHLRTPSTQNLRPPKPDEAGNAFPAASHNEHAHLLQITEADEDADIADAPPASPLHAAASEEVILRNLEMEKLLPPKLASAANLDLQGFFQTKTPAPLNGATEDMFSPLAGDNPTFKALFTQNPLPWLSISFDPSGQAHVCVPAHPILIALSFLSTQTMSNASPSPSHYGGVFFISMILFYSNEVHLDVTSPSNFSQQGDQLMLFTPLQGSNGGFQAREKTWNVQDMNDKSKPKLKIGIDINFLFQFGFNLDPG